MRKTLLSILLLSSPVITIPFFSAGKNELKHDLEKVLFGFNNPQDSTRTKVWWFHGETETTTEGITDDL